MTDYTDLIARLRLLQRYHGDNDAGEAADALEAQARRIAALEAESKARLTDASTAWDLCETLRARIAELEAALKPFADHADKINHELISAKTVFEARKGHTLYYGDFRAARAAYLGEKE